MKKVLPKPKKSEIFLDSRGRLEYKRDMNANLRTKACWIYTVKDAARFFGVTEAVIRLEVKRGKLTCSRIGPTIIFTWSDFVRYFGSEERALDLFKKEAP